ncbi:FMN-binding glutamate synthase family protein, partial [Bordetella hinzii]|nr:FMN-binding glutamate synthase family protein [Bordetella hinzii]
RTHHIARRISSSEVRLLSALFPELTPGELLRGEFRHNIFKVGWSMATPDSFQPVTDITTALAELHHAQAQTA